MKLLKRLHYPKGWDAESYLHRCEKDGYCGDIYAQNEFGLIIDHIEGLMFLYPTEGIPFTYVCCTGCQLPVSYSEEKRINKKLGFELKADVDDDFMKALEGF